MSATMPAPPEGSSPAILGTTGFVISLTTVLDRIYKIFQDESCLSCEILKSCSKLTVNCTDNRGQVLITIQQANRSDPTRPRVKTLMYILDRNPANRHNRKLS